MITSFYAKGALAAGVVAIAVVTVVAGRSQAPATTDTRAAREAAGESAKKNGVTCRTERVAMRDGTLLATDIYLPPTPGRYPVIMQRTPYGMRLGHGCFVGTS